MAPTVTTVRRRPHRSAVATLVDRVAVERLRGEIRGTVFVPGDVAYEPTRQVWNALRDQCPAVIARCTGPADIVAAVRFARDHGLKLAVRGGGHSGAGFSTCDGGLMIDTEPMRGIWIDPVERTAVVQAGVTWGELDREAQLFGLATTGAPLSRIGVAGFALGGGIGHLQRACGLGCDNLIGADIVTADGEVVQVTGDERPELLWGLRGGGGNFGVVTSMVFRLHRVDPIVTAGTIYYPARHAETLLRFYRDYASDLADDVTTQFAMVKAPPAAFLPDHVHGMSVVAITAVSVGSLGSGERHLGPLRDAAPVIADRLGPTPYLRLQSRADGCDEARTHYEATSGYVQTLDDGAIDALISAQVLMPGRTCELRLHQMGGAVARVGSLATAVPNRSAPYLLEIAARWKSPDRSGAHHRWTRTARTSVEPWMVGGPDVNFNSAPGLAEQAYGAEQYLRLAALKSRCDPENVFRPDANVVPLT